MDIVARLAALKKRDQELDLEIRQKNGRAGGDSERLKCLKRQKLRVTSRIEALTGC